MAYVYILYSKQIDKFYIGSCLDITLRLQQHKNIEFKKAFTINTGDWELFFQINELDYKQARN